jgi:hypothetical protein
MEMEIKYYQKEKWQILLPLVIKIVTLLFVFNFISCATKVQIEPKNKSIYKIINKELNYLTSYIEMEKVFLEKRLTNNLLSDLEDLKFHKEDYQYHFLTTFFSLPKDEFEYLFNEDQINQYKKQFIGERIIESSKIENKNLLICDTEKLKYSGDINNVKTYITLSYPVFSKNNEYALIKYSLGNTIGDGNSSIAIYKKENNKWKLYRRVGLGIG